jgi:membrane protease YdiL (CAAX protease family)
MDITTLRKHRIILEPPFFNSSGNGIALLDLSLTFIVAYVLEPYILPYLKISRLAYYLILLPLGVIIHLIFKQDTFLNKQLFNNPINIYQILMVIILYKLYKELV